MESWHHVTKITSHTWKWLHMTKGYQCLFLFFFFFFLPGSRWCCPPNVNDWKQEEPKRGKGKEREKKDEWEWRWCKRGNRGSALRALGWQTGSWVYYAYEWGGGDTLSLSISTSFIHPPLSVSFAGQSEVAAPYLEVDVSLCFFWQTTQATQLAKR